MIKTTERRSQTDPGSAAILAAFAEIGPVSKLVGSLEAGWKPALPGSAKGCLDLDPAPSFSEVHHLLVR